MVDWVGKRKGRKGSKEKRKQRKEKKTLSESSHLSFPFLYIETANKRPSTTTISQSSAGQAREGKGADISARKCELEIPWGKIKTAFDNSTRHLYKIVLTRPHKRIRHTPRGNRSRISPLLFSSPLSRCSLCKKNRTGRYPSFSRKSNRTDPQALLHGTHEPLQGINRVSDTEGRGSVFVQNDPRYLSTFPLLKKEKNSSSLAEGFAVCVDHVAVDVASCTISREWMCLHQASSGLHNRKGKAIPLKGRSWFLHSGSVVRVGPFRILGSGNRRNEVFLRGMTVLFLP